MGEKRDCNEVILVLGAGIMRDMSRRRAHRAFEYNHNTYIIPTGGRGGFLGNYMNKTEAEQIGDYLTKLGIEKRLIKTELNSRNTEENFRKSKPLIDLLNPEKVIIVTNKAHMKRAVGYAEKILSGYKIIPLPTTPKWYDFAGQLDEILCFLYENTKIPIEKMLSPRAHMHTA